MTAIEELWHDDRNFIITAKHKVNANQCFQYLKKNMRKYPDESTFLIITGHHHIGLDESNVAKLGEPDPKLEDSIDSEWTILNSKKRLGKKCEEDNKCSPQCDNCVWQKKRFKMNTINFKTKDVTGEGPYRPSGASVDKLKPQFEFLSTSKTPVVFVYFSCWSHYSPINTILCAHGLYAVLALKKDRSELTIERWFQLAEEQQEYLKMVVDDSQTKKDLIIAGKYFLV
jgi:hypothetical protein